MTVEGVDRTSPLPLYHQLKLVIQEEIRSRGLGPGARLPGDHELCARHGLSRTVVRQAMTELEFEGVLERVRGRGTYVADRRAAEGTAPALTGLSEDVAARGGVLRTQVLLARIGPADPDVAVDLRIRPGTGVTTLERLRFVDGRPSVLTRTHVPEAIAPDLAEQDLTARSLYELLESRYGVRLRSGRRSVEAVIAGADVAARLDLAPAAPVLVLRSVSVGEDGVPVESYVSHHGGDRARVEVDLRRRA